MLPCCRQLTAQPQRPGAFSTSSRTARPSARVLPLAHHLKHRSSGAKVVLTTLRERAPGAWSTRESGCVLWLPAGTHASARAIQASKPWKEPCCVTTSEPRSVQDDTLLRAKVGPRYGRGTSRELRSSALELAPVPSDVALHRVSPDLHLSAPPAQITHQCTNESVPIAWSTFLRDSRVSPASKHKRLDDAPVKEPEYEAVGFTTLECTGDVVGTHSRRTVPALPCPRGRAFSVLESES